MNRRDFLTRLMSGAATLAAPAGLSLPTSARAQTAAPSPNAGSRQLAVVSRTLDINGRAARVFGLTQPDGTQGLVLNAGTSFDATLANAIDAPTLIHWHGLTPPWGMDGVPDNPAASLRPAETRRYTFPAGAGGTHWMHARTLQEQNLLAAPLIVRTDEDRQRDEQEVVILLHDFSFTPAEELLARLRGTSAAGAGMGHGTMTGHGMPDQGAMGQGAMGQGAMNHAGMMNHGAMAGMDLNDIDYDAYLANDRTLDDPQAVPVEKGGRVRLRIINGATATAFTIDTGALAGTLIAVDGQQVQPVAGNAFPVSMGQRLDIRLRLPPEGGAYPILALREGAAERAGIILASAGAEVRKLPVRGESAGPVLGLDLERRLSAARPLAARAPDSRFTLTLTGGMAGYVWGLEGGDALQVAPGERIEVAFVNATMMAHPMHLHGHHFQVTAIDGVAIAGAVRDTVLVPPHASVTVAFDAGNPGHWPLHCHHLYHMVTGMMAFVAYAA
ncbi:FtsP/CotA-like multicopper oxidase with cupredoxin domain [Pseudochelatococcus lubricantis]|uniref:FtsP/CotA-like multicopper oxidase with cupredoxin domain n=1 Tax=Pseudochelatococcus lubricantis TaxID=1538102 RepID=A0ABX0V8A5_9HYPH|nr:multicopper oxidase domain-containing protein [Pseudochelatococcus lubricantis]NIJ59995.1 FtsP/CotA-like multicopper oxidase with cupredoxin domain [Pseudochelatococcus lubricantis]